MREDQGSSQVVSWASFHYDRSTRTASAGDVISTVPPTTCVAATERSGRPTRLSSSVRIGSRRSWRRPRGRARVAGV